MASVPAGLGRRGAALWRAMTKGIEPDVAMKALMLEACRCTDRLDRLERRIRANGDDLEWAMREARLQQQGLRQLLATIGLDRAPATPVPGSAEERRSSVDDLASRRAARIAGTAGPQPS